MLGGYEFRWDASHILFLGAFYTVLLVVGTYLAVSTLRARRDLKLQKAQGMMWHEEFEELPSWRRQCRHALTGELPGRECEQAFDCRECLRHGDLLAHTDKDSRPRLVPSGNARVYGFQMPLDRYYHRGHTWVRPADGGLLEVGLDDLGRRLIGTPDVVHLPAPGSRLSTNGTGWELRSGDASTRILSPVDGTVVETGGAGDDWVLRVRPTQAPPVLTHLLRGPEVGPWVLSELERLQRLLGAQSAGPTLADGGAPAEDFTRAVPDADWDGVYGEMFLEA